MAPSHGERTLLAFAGATGRRLLGFGWDDGSRCSVGFEGTFVGRVGLRSFMVRIEFVAVLVRR